MNPAQTKTWLFAARLVNVDRICSEISAWLLEKDLSKHLFPLEMLTREAINNAIIHGCRLNSDMQIRCELQCHENMLRLKINDDGPGFNWRAHIQEDTVASYIEHGRGIKLYRFYADTVEFNERGNQVILIRLLKKDQPPATLNKGERK